MRCRNVVTARGEPIWQTEIHRAHVDAQLQRSRRDDGAHVAGLEALLGLQAAVLGEAAVVGADTLGPQALAEVMRHALGHAARVDEDQRRAVRAHERRESVVDLAPLLVGRHGLQVRGRHLDGQIEIAPVPDVDHRAGKARAHEEARGLLDGVHGGRQTDALGTALGHGVEARERQREVAAALVAHQGVQLVDDHGAHALHQATRAFRGEHQVQRLGRGDEDVRRALRDGRASRRRRVARAERRRDHRRGKPQLLGRRPDPLQRQLEVLVDVAAQGLEGRDVDDVDSVAELAFSRPVHEPIEGRQERREGLARAGRRGDEGVAPRDDLRPPLLLCSGGPFEGLLEPGANGGVERRGERHVQARHGSSILRVRPLPGRFRRPRTVFLRCVIDVTVPGRGA